MKYGSRKLEIGEEVRIVDLENNTFISAKYRGDIDIHGEFEGGLAFCRDTPKFELEDGSFKYGYECWWIPEKEAERTRQFLKEKGDI